MTNNQLSITLTSNGRTLILGSGGDYDITEITGLEASSFILNTSKKVRLPGRKVDSKSIDARSIHIVASAKNSSNNPVLRANTIKFFNPDYTGTMTVSNMGTVREIDYEIEGWAFSKQENLDCPLEIVVDLSCPEAYFRNISNFGKNMASVIAQFAFPWRSLASKVSDIPAPYKYMGHQGFITGYKRISQYTDFINDGDVKTGIRVKMIATRGEVVNPFITYAEDGRYVKVIKNLNQGDTLEISTIEGDEYIKYNGANAYQYIDRQSQTFLLEVGDNNLSYGADSNSTNLDVYLYYVPKYLGV